MSIFFFLKTRSLAEIKNSMGNRDNCFSTPNLTMLRKVCVSDDAPRVHKFNPVGQMLLLFMGALTNRKVVIRVILFLGFCVCTN